MRRCLQLCALALAVIAIAWWALAGAHRGWTQTTVTRMATDEVTGLEQIINEKKFVPGIELLGLALVLAGGLAATSLFFRSKPKQSSTP